MSRISATCAADWAAFHHSALPVLPTNPLRSSINYIPILELALKEAALRINPQRSSSQSRSHSRPFHSARNNGNRSNDTRQPKQEYIPVTLSSASPSSFRTEQSQPIGRPLITLTNPSITPEEVAALRQQILDLSATIRSLDERVDWFSVGLVKSVLVRF
ncbi:unnamed protein product [Rhizophagus irregularis]|nr:unnamed protein product [Rhizophagus irregularis]